jgi:exosome complex component RRP4
VSKHVKESDQEGEEGFDAEAVYSNQNDVCYLILGSLMIA